MFRRTLSIAFVLATLCSAGLSLASPDLAPAQSWSLVVDSDTPNLLPPAVVAARLGSELHVPVSAAGAGATGAGAGATGAGAGATGATIAITYRAATRWVSVRARHPDGRVVERAMTIQGEPSAAQTEIVLLASNVARDEAGELLAELAAARRAGSVTAASAPPVPDVLPAPAGPAAAVETRPEERRIATFAVLYPLATNMGHPNVRTPLDVSLVYGSVGRIGGGQFSLGAAYAARGVTGLQLTTLGASGGDVHGAQVGLLGTYSHGSLEGLALGGLAVIAGGNARGAQLAVGAAYAGGQLEGVQAATAIAIAAGGADGAQVAAGATYVDGPMTGVQASALANVATSTFSGVQVSAGANVALEPTEGLQLGGVNVGSEVTGAQIGLVNVGRRVKGLQLGLVNIASEVDGAAIGLASISRDSVHPVAWASNLAYTNVGVRFTSKSLYTTLAVGLGTNETKLDGGLSVTSGIGAHVPLFGRFDLDGELAYTHVSASSKTNQSLAAHAIAGYAFAKRFRLFVGGGPRIPLVFEEGDPAVRPEVVAGALF